MSCGSKGRGSASEANISELKRAGRSFRQNGGFSWNRRRRQRRQRRRRHKFLWGAAAASGSVDGDGTHSESSLEPTQSARADGPSARARVLPLPAATRLPPLPPPAADDDTSRCCSSSAGCALSLWRPRVHRLGGALVASCDHQWLAARARRSHRSRTGSVKAVARRPSESRAEPSRARQPVGQAPPTRNHHRL